MSPSLSTFLLEAANFLILAFGLGWLFFKPVRRALAAEQEAQRRVAAEAAQEKAEAERIRAEIEAQKAQLARTLEAQQAEARAQAAQASEQLLRDARAQAEREREAARRELESERRASTESLVGDIASLASSALVELLGWLTGPELDVALARAAARQLGKPDGALVIESAHPLDVEEQKSIRALLDGAQVQFRVRDSLGSGLRVIAPGTLVDASAAGLAEHARRSIEARLNERLEARHAG